MITMLDEEIKKCFGDEVELDDYDIDAVVDRYVKMGPPDQDYMDKVVERWATTNPLSSKCNL